MPRKASPSPHEGLKKKVSSANSIHGELKRGEVICDNKGKTWKLGKAIGIGGFGEIYDVADNCSNKQMEKSTYVAKIEKHTNGPLFVEINCYLRLGKLEMIEEWKQAKDLSFLGLPHFVASGSHLSNGNKYRFLILPKYDKDLEAIFQTKRIFNLKTVLVIASRIIDTLEYIHNQGYVHSDIKASNIMLGHGQNGNQPIKRKSSRHRSPIKRFGSMCLRRSKPIAKPILKLSVHNLRPVGNHNYIDDIPYLDDVLKEYERSSESDEESKVIPTSFEGDQVYLLDYGLASKFLLSNGEHKDFGPDQRKAHAGTVLFCSRDAHKGIPSRRSDLESLAYNMIYWLTGILPWVDDIHEPELVEKKKNRCFTDVKTFLQICFEDCPKFLIEMFIYLSTLQFKDIPNYDFFRMLFKKTIKDYGYNDDSKLDFDNLEGWGRKQKKIGKVKSNRKENKIVCKRPSFLLYSPLKPLSSNIIFKRPKLRKKIKDKLAKNSMMNWSKILIMDPETIIKQATHRKNPEDDRSFNISESDLKQLNPTPTMEAIFHKACEIEDKSPYSWHDDQICSIDTIDGYTSEMMRIHQKIIEERILELELVKQQLLVPKKRGRKKKAPTSPKFSGRNAKAENKLKDSFDNGRPTTASRFYSVTSQHALRKVKNSPLKRTYRLRG